jgi:hypothetical protein
MLFDVQSTGPLTGAQPHATNKVARKMAFAERLVHLSKLRTTGACLSRACGGRVQSRVLWRGNTWATFNMF